jgi:LmbE family N-acetylglucosaminyl deacetylase
VTGTSGNGARFAAAPLDGGGTSAQQWLSATPLPELDLLECPGLVVIAPHPDDETLGLGATMAELAERGVDVTVISVTDGGGEFPGSSEDERARLGDIRRRELISATDCLGLSDPISLGLRDGYVADDESRLTAMLVGVLADRPAGTWCAATWRGDGHPDHEAAGRAAARATHATAAVLVEYPVWMWHWAAPADPAVPWQRGFKVPLSSSSLERKQEAVQCFQSQFAPGAAGQDPVLPAYVVPRLLAVGEVMFR